MVVITHKTPAPIAIRQKLIATGDTSGIILAKTVAVLMHINARARIILIRLPILENMNRKTHFHYVSLF